MPIADVRHIAECDAGDDVRVSEAILLRENV